MLIYIKNFESFSIKSFYHGSYDKLHDGIILKPHKDSYTRQEDNYYIESILEKYRPNNKLSRYDSVFLVDNIDNIDDAGASIDYIYEVFVSNEDIPEKSDLTWYTEIDMTDDIEKHREYAMNYWNGVQFYDIEMSLWEYRVKKAYIVQLVEEN